MAKWGSTCNHNYLYRWLPCQYFILLMMGAWRPKHVEEVYSNKSASCCITSVFYLVDVNIWACERGWNRRLVRIVLCSLIHSYAICIMIRDLYSLLFAGWDYSNQRKEADDLWGGCNSGTDTCDTLVLCSGVQLRSPFFLVMAPPYSVIGTQSFGTGWCFRLQYSSVWTFDPWGWNHHTLPIHRAPITHWLNALIPRNQFNRIPEGRT